jgi:hypothetical protein
MNTILLFLFQTPTPVPSPVPIPIDQPPALWFLFMAMGYIIALFLGLLAFAIVKRMWGSDFDLVLLICDEQGKPSLGRFQNLIFTVVIAMGLFWIIGRLGDFPQTIPPNILLLLGISAGTMAIGKGIDARHFERQNEIRLEDERIRLERGLLASERPGGR